MRKLLFAGLSLLCVASTAQAAAADPKKPAEAPKAEAPKANDPAGYKPKTQYDNTPMRFSMTQNGKKMSADDFDAWLKANGYNAGKRAEAKPAAAPVVTEVADEKSSKKKK